MPGLRRLPLMLRLLVMVSLMTRSITVCAADATPVELETLVQEVLAESFDLKIAKDQIEQADARIGSTRSRFLPKLSLSASRFEQDPSNTTFGVLTGSSSAFSQNGYTSKAAAQWNLFNGFQDSKRFQQRSKEFEKSKSDADATYYAKRDAALTSIFRILTLQSDIGNIEEKIRVEKDRERDLAKRYLSRSARRSDLLAVQASILSSTSDLQTAQLELQSEWKTISDLAGRDLPVRTVLSKDKDLQKIKTPIEASVDIEKLPDVESSRLDFEASEMAYQSLRGQFLPSLDIAYNYYFDRPGFQKDTQWDFQVMASIAIPLDGDKTNSVREARALANQRESLYYARKNSRRLELDKMVAQYNAELDRLQTLERSVSVQEKLVNSFRHDYSSGLISISDYLNSVSQLLQTRQKRDRLFYQQMQRRHQIDDRVAAARSSQ